MLNPCLFLNIWLLDYCIGIKNIKLVYRIFWNNLLRLKRAIHCSLSSPPACLSLGGTMWIALLFKEPLRLQGSWGFEGTIHQTTLIYSSLEVSSLNQPQAAPLVGFFPVCNKYPGTCLKIDYPLGWHMGCPIVLKNSTLSGWPEMLVSLSWKQAHTLSGWR